MKKLLLKFWAPLFLFLLVTVLSLANFSPDTFLSGWDNLHPEFNPLMNLERAWQSAWQEYQGLGLLAGMAHSADLFRQLIFLPLELLLPANLFRYVWHFLMILVGVLGSFYLFKFFLSKRSNQNLLAFLGASFYLLNFATVQNFYVTFEPFAVFYAFLPILLLLLLQLLSQQKISKARLFVFIVLSVLATSMAYVQTIFVVYFSLACLLLLITFLQKKASLKRVLFFFSLILLLNSFWLFNVLHFTAFSSALLSDSKNKAMSNDVLILKNQAFGDYWHLLKMQGFWLGQTDFDEFGNTIYLFDAWKTHFSYWTANVLAYVFFALLILGLWQIFRQKDKNRYFILSVSLLSLWMMAIETFPFNLLSAVAKKVFPLFDEMFRINFTKWVVPFSLFYSLLLVYGLLFIFSLLKKKIFKFLFSLLFFVALIFYSWPSFQGHFFYERLRVKIPQAYFDLFTYFKNAPLDSRIANLPQHSFYGWQWNNWGYRGSGFLWYGIKQPILDRAFDVWSEADERYYWQLQAALDKKDVKMLEKVFMEYDVDYLLLDESVVNRNTLKPFNYQVIKELLAESSRLKLVENFAFISLYSFSDDENSHEKNFISLYETLPIINNKNHYSWSDQAFNNFHDYLSESNNNANNANIIYPFSSFFTNHLQKDLEFTLAEDENYFYLTSQKTLSTEGFDLQVADPVISENALPFHLSWQTEGDKTKLTFKLILPEFYLAQKKFFFDFTKELTLNTKLCQKDQDCYLNINNQLIKQFSSSGETDLLLNTKLLNTIAFSSSNKVDYFDYVFFNLNDYELKVKNISFSQSENLVVKIPKVLLYADLLKTDLNKIEVDDCRPADGGSVFKEKRSEGNYYQATGTSNCDHFYLADLKHNNSYLFKLNANNLSSIPLLFALQVESLGRSPLETYLSEGINYQIIPPLENFNQGYTLYFSTDSYGKEINANLLKSAEVFFWPYKLLNNLYLQSVTTNYAKATLSSCDFAVTKKALWLYKVERAQGCQSAYLKLSQAYDQGWLAVSNGRFLKHEQVNNWANLWLVDKEETGAIYIFFWPQLLEYFGIALLFACFLCLKMR